jgi:hypothetical protein
MCCSRGSERGFRSATSSGEFAVAFEWNGRRFQFCIRRFQSIRRFFLQPCHSPGRHPESASGQPRAVPDVVGSGLASPYHFRARIQSFQTLAAPFPGDSVLPSGPLAPRSRRPKRLGSKDRRSARQSPPGRRYRNKHRTTAQLWQEICSASWELRNFRPASRNRRLRVGPEFFGLRSEFEGAARNRERIDLTRKEFRL